MDNSAAAKTPFDLETIQTYVLLFSKIKMKINIHQDQGETLSLFQNLCLLDHKTS